MRHRKDKLKLSRPRSQRKALKNLLVQSLLKQERIKTTLAKAKVASRYTERLITLAKKDTLSARRQAYKLLGNHALVKRLFSEIAPRFKDIAGGYTRVLKLGFRKGDGAALALVELKSKARENPEAKTPKAAAQKKEGKKASSGEKKEKKPAEKKAKAKKGLKRLFGK